MRKVVLGCSIVFCICFVGAAALILYFYNKVSGEAEAREEAYYTAAPGTKIFINKSDAVPTNLKDRFVPFAFHYPDRFVVIPDKNSFIKIERQENGAPVEIFAVTPLTIPSPKAKSETIYPALMKQMSQWLADNNPGYREASQKPADFKSAYFYRDGWEMCWQSEAQDSSPPSIRIYGRVLLLRESITSRGVTIMMFAAGSDPDVSNAADVGERGDLGSILRSFRLISTSNHNPASAAQQMSRTRTGR